MCVHHFTPWNRCESAPLPTQSQPSTVVSPYSESSPILLSGAPASSNGPHPDRRPHDARFCHPLVFCVRSFLRTSGGLERPPSLSSERLPPRFRDDEADTSAIAPTYWRKTPRVSSESPGDRTRTLIISWLFQSHMAKPARGKAATQCCESVLGRGPRALPSPRGEKHTRLHPGSFRLRMRVCTQPTRKRGCPFRWTLPRRHHLS